MQTVCLAVAKEVALGHTMNWRTAAAHFMDLQIPCNSNQTRDRHPSWLAAHDLIYCAALQQSSTSQQRMRTRRRAGGRRVRSLWRDAAEGRLFGVVKRSLLRRRLPGALPIAVSVQHSVHETGHADCLQTCGGRLGRRQLPVSNKVTCTQHGSTRPHNLIMSTKAQPCVKLGRWLGMR